MEQPSESTALSNGEHRFSEQNHTTIENQIDENCTTDMKAQSGAKKKHRKHEPAVDVAKVPRMKAKYKCNKSFCRGRFSRRPSYDRHLQCHSKHGLACFLCDEKFAMWRTCSTHMWRCHALDFDLYKCDDCDFRCLRCSVQSSYHCAYTCIGCMHKATYL